MKFNNIEGTSWHYRLQGDIATIIAVIEVPQKKNDWVCGTLMDKLKMMYLYGQGAKIAVALELQWFNIYFQLVSAILQ